MPEFLIAITLLVGNYTDLNTKQVDFTTAKQFADEQNMTFLEASAKNGTNVEQIFLTMASEIRNNYASSTPLQKYSLGTIVGCRLSGFK